MSSSPAAPHKNVHEEVHQIREDGLVAVITRRIYNDIPRYSFAFMKEFERNGKTERSHWQEKRHLDSLRKLIERVEAWVEMTEDRERTALREKLRAAP
jgi:NAD(P)H-dependent FMN reductase